MTSNVNGKVKNCPKRPAMDATQELKLVVFGDSEPVSYRMWRSIFGDDVMNYRTDFPMVPLPANYTPEGYEQYERELKEIMAMWAAQENFIFGVYNLAAPAQDPRMHLVMATRLVRRSELGRWAHTDKSESLDNDGAHQDARFISIESLRDLVSDILDFDPISSEHEVNSATSSSKRRKRRSARSRAGTKRNPRRRS